jgi:hypothetical protein
MRAVINHALYPTVVNEVDSVDAARLSFLQTENTRLQTENDTLQTENTAHTELQGKWTALNADYETVCAENKQVREKHDNKEGLSIIDRAIPLLNAATLTEYIGLPENEAEALAAFTTNYQ